MVYEIGAFILCDKLQSWFDEDVVGNAFCFADVKKCIHGHLKHYCQYKICKFLQRTRLCKLHDVFLCQRRVS